LLVAFGAAPSFGQSRFTVSADGQEVLDTKSNLSWRRCAEGMKWDGTTCTGKALTFKLSEAKTLAVDAGKADGKTWRVPSKDELASLVDRGQKKKPKIDITIFPATPPQLFWALRPGFDDDLNAWLVNFANGKVYTNSGMRKNYLRLVRIP
jgi:hypothetical protein